MPPTPDSLNYQPPPGLTNPHLQTMLSSVVRKQIVLRQFGEFLQAAEARIVQVDGVQLSIEANLRAGAPTVAIIPGWLGTATSSYVISAAQSLWQAGFGVVRINLRDHGDSAHLNPGLFNSACITEVVELIEQLQTEHPQGLGLVGFSLGGNFTLRVARHLPGLPTVAICPAIEPNSAMTRIHTNPVYHKYFLHKWRKIWQTKQQAFPQMYDFSDALKINSVSVMTDYFVRYHSDFRSTDAYFSAYDLSGDYLHGVDATILTAADDPIIPLAQFANLPSSVTLHVTPTGGHTAYLKNWRLESWVDDYLCAHFASRLQH